MTEMFLPTILVVDTNDKKSRDFLDSLTGDEYASFVDVIDWNKPSHKERVENYVFEESLPPLFHTFPACWVILEPQYIYQDNDRIAIISDPVGDAEAWNQAVDRGEVEGRTTPYQWIVNRGIESMIGVIIETRMMSERYKREYVKKLIALASDIPVDVALKLQACESLELIKICYYRLIKEGMIQRQFDLEYQVQQRFGLELYETFVLKIPPERVLLPANLEDRFSS